MNILFIIILILGSQLVYTIEINEVSLTPYITQFIVPFDMPTQDLRIAIQKQLSSNDFKTNKFTSDHILVQNLIYRAKYNGTGKIITPNTTSSFHKVTGDDIDLTVSFHATFNHLLPTKKSFNCSTKLKIYLEYTKQIDVNDGKTDFVTPKVTIDAKSFQMSYSGNPTKAQKQKLDMLNNGQISKQNNVTILQLLQNQEFTAAKILNYFKENVVEQKLSPTYNSTYQYTFNAANITFDMTTGNVKPIEKGIAHSVKGFIKNFNNYGLVSPQSSYIKEDSYSTLITVDFISNFLQYNFENNPDWRNFKLEYASFKTKIFQFKLLDLQFIFDNLLKQYSRYYLNDIRIVCNAKSFSDWKFIQQASLVNLSIQWQCQGYLTGPSPNPLIMDFDADMKYSVKLSVQNSMLSVQLTDAALNLLKFKLISNFILNDLRLAEIYAKQIVSLIRKGKTIGTNFKLKQGSKFLTFKQGEGIWIG